MAWRLPGSPRGKDLAAAVVLSSLAADQSKWLTMLLDPRARGTRTSRSCVSVGRFDCGKMHDLVSKRRGRRARGKRVGSQEAMYEAGWRRGDARDRPKLGGGGKPGFFGADAEVPLSSRPGTASACDSNRGSRTGLTPPSPRRGTFGRPSRCAAAVPKLGLGQGSQLFGAWSSARPRVELASDLRPDLRTLRWRARNGLGGRPMTGR